MSLPMLNRSWALLCVKICKRALMRHVYPFPTLRGRVKGLCELVRNGVFTLIELGIRQKTLADMEEWEKVYEEERSCIEKIARGSFFYNLPRDIKEVFKKRVERARMTMQELGIDEKRFLDDTNVG